MKTWLAKHVFLATTVSCRQASPETFMLYSLTIKSWKHQKPQPCSHCRKHQWDRHKLNTVITTTQQPTRAARSLTDHNFKFPHARTVHYACLQNLTLPSSAAWALHRNVVQTDAQGFIDCSLTPNPPILVQCGSPYRTTGSTATCCSYCCTGRKTSECSNSLILA